MAVIDIEALLAPVSDEAPCGRDLEYDAAYMTLQEEARGKPEQSIGDKVKPAQEPAWGNVRDSAEALFKDTKDLRIAGILHLALLKTAGVPGLEGGLGLMRFLVERYWDNNLYPLLDADDDNDPTFRVNTLVAALVSDDAMQCVRFAPLVESRQFGKHSLRNYRIATGTLKATLPDGSDIDATQEKVKLEGAFADATVEALTETGRLLTASMDHLNTIQKVLIEKAGGFPDDLRNLTSDLREMKSILDAQMAKRGIGAGDPAAEGASAEGGAAGGPSGGGAIRNRTDVLTTIDRICDYYARTEPSSPVPLLLQRAKRLVNKDFMEIIRDLTPAGVTEAEVIGGLGKGDS